MKILVVGSGGREHAVIKKLKESPLAEEIYALPGNGGISQDAVCVPIGAMELEKIRDFARRTMKDDLQRMEYVPGNYYNFHPGNHVGQGSEKGIELIAEILNEIMTKDQTTTVLLETMAGKGTEIGRNFSEIRAIYDKVNLKEKIGVCLDTCHVFDGGYDVVNKLDDVLLEFDNIIGLEKLKAIHLNDSKHGFESHKDRHEKIGEGSIGFEAMKKIINHPKLKHLPFLLETPNELSGYADEIKMLKEAYNND